VSPRTPHAAEPIIAQELTGEFAQAVSIGLRPHSCMPMPIATRLDHRRASGSWDATRSMARSALRPAQKRGGDADGSTAPLCVSTGPPILPK